MSHQADSPNYPVIGPSTYHLAHIYHFLLAHIYLSCMCRSFHASYKRQNIKKSKYAKLQKHVFLSVGFPFLCVLKKKNPKKYKNLQKPKTCTLISCMRILLLASWKKAKNTKEIKICKTTKTCFPFLLVFAFYVFTRKKP